MFEGHRRVTFVDASNLIWENIDESSIHVILPNGEQVPVWIHEYGTVDKDGNLIHDVLEKIHPPVPSSIDQPEMYRRYLEETNKRYV